MGVGLAWDKNVTPTPTPPYPQTRGFLKPTTITSRGADVVLKLLRHHDK